LARLSEKQIGKLTVRLQVCKNTVIPAKAGIQTKDVNSVFLTPRLRGDDGKIELANGLSNMRETLSCPFYLDQDSV